MIAASFGLGARGCVQTENSFSDDPSLYSGVGTGGPEFVAFKQIMFNRCSSCHADFVSNTEAEWISEGKVVAANPDGSPLFQRIRGSGTGGLENMPPDVTLPTSEIESIRTWINSL